MTDRQALLRHPEKHFIEKEKDKEGRRSRQPLERSPRFGSAMHRTTRSATSCPKLNPPSHRLWTSTRPGLTSRHGSQLWGPRSGRGADDDGTSSTPEFRRDHDHVEHGREPPVGFQWVMKAKERGGQGHPRDPRYTRPGAAADIHMPLRSGTNIRSSAAV